MKMNRALMLAVTVAIGSFLEGSVYVLLFGYPSYMKEELNLESGPVLDSLVWFVSMIGILLAIASGRIGGIGRRPLLVLSSMLYLFSSVVMLLSADRSLILVARFLDGFAWGFSCMLVVCYFMETYPRGFCRLMLPQLCCFCGVCLSIVVVLTSLIGWAGWKFIFEVDFSLSLLYFILVIFCVPESPKWLVRKGRNDEARHVLQMLHSSDDVSDEMRVLVYGLRVESGGSVEDLFGEDLEYGPEDVSSGDLSKPVTLTTEAQQQGTIERSQNASLTDSLLTPSAYDNANEDSLTQEGDDSRSSAADSSVLIICVSK